MDLESFKKILNMTQEDVKLTCFKYLVSKNYDVRYGDGFVYGEGDIPVMLVAHMDTVHKELPSNIYYDEKKFVMWSPQGIGGDDRCGVFSIMEILKEYKPYVLFLEDEEIGSIGADKAVKKLDIPDINFIIELDRRGVNDCVFYDCGNVKFQKYIEGFGFKKQIGSFTDICTLSGAWDVASVNLSIGYFNEHTKYETINTVLMEATIKKVKKILEENKVKSKYYKYDEVKKVWTYHNSSGLEYNEDTGTWDYDYSDIANPKDNYAGGTL